MLSEESEDDKDFSDGSSNLYIPESSDISTDEIPDTPPQSVVRITASSSRPDDTTIHAPVKSKKRICHPMKWHKNIKKIKRNSGQSYTTSSGKEIPARKVKSSCTETCRLKCSSKISDSERQEIHLSYWALSDIVKQREFLVRHFEPIKPKYTMRKPGSKRTYNNRYYFNIQQNRVQVCKTFFKNTLDINNRVIYTATKKISNTGFLEKDKRGGHKNAGRPRIEEERKNFARRHIEQFPLIDSHYCRARTQRKYLQGDLNLSEMYRLYLRKCTEENIQPIKKHLYETIFNTEYNISFFQPKKDICGFCDNFKNLSGEEKQQKQESYNCHINEKNQSRIEKENDLKSCASTTVVSCFDLQAVQTVPSGDRSDFFYKRRLSCYNFTIYEINNKQGYCFLWHEGLANRGVNEIGSCLIKYLREHVTAKDVIFYSDNCPGQNKNKYVWALYSHVVKNTQIESITHKFFVVGHTQNEGDAMHALIEREKKRSLKGGPLFVPTQLTPIINLAKKNGKPYITNEFRDFLNIKALVKNTDNFTKNNQGETVKWSDVHIVQIKKNEPNMIFYKNSFFDDEFKVIDVDRRTRRQQAIITELKPAYNNPPGITKLKKKDLLDLCKTGAIPQAHWNFYENLPTVSEERTQEDDSD